MKTQFCLCPKCNGKERLDWTDNDGGICYKCEGKGYQGEQNIEFDNIIKDLRLSYTINKNNSIKIQKLNNFIAEKLWSNSKIRYSKDMSIEDLIFFCDKSFTTYSINVNEKFLSGMPKFIVFSLYSMKTYSRMIESNQWEIYKQQLISQNKSFMIDRIMKNHNIVGEYGRVEVINNGNSITVNFLEINK